MSLPYDEIYISTRREIRVCEDAIRELTRKIEAFSARHSMSTQEALAEHEKCGLRCSADLAQWRECAAGVRNWEERLRGLRAILDNPPL